jgi:hypothetical protein
VPEGGFSRRQKMEARTILAKALAEVRIPLTAGSKPSL